jgi:FkbM family methyltransferase
LRLSGGPAEDTLFDQIERAGGRYGGGVLRALPRLLPRDGVVIDAGAHIGLIALPASTLVPEGHVHAVEPVPASADLLEANARAARAPLSVHRLALSDRSGRARMVHEERFSAGSTLGGAGPSAAEVLVRSLDDLAHEVGLTRLDLIKLDVEGTEVAVLRGGRATLARFRPALIVECNPPALMAVGGTSVRDLHEELTRYTAELVWLGRGGAWRRIRGPDHLVWLLGRHGVGDVLAMPDPVRAPLSARALAGRAHESVIERIPGGARFVVEAGPVVRAVTSPAAQMRPGENAALTIELHNAGSTAMGSAHRRHPVNVAARWWSAPGDLAAEGERAVLARPLAPGGSARLTLRLTAPTAPGRYEVVVSAVQEGFAWLDGYGPDAAARWTVVVGGGPGQSQAGGCTSRQ